MATWQDGPEYAPTSPPEGFATPVVEPLDSAPAAPSLTPGPVPPPERMEAVDAPPLKSLGQPTAQQRDPGSPFSVVSALLTAEPSQSGGRRDPKTPFKVISTAMGSAGSVEDATPPPPPPDATPLAPAYAPAPPQTNVAPQPHPSASPQTLPHVGQTSLQAPQRAVPQQQYQPVRQWDPVSGRWQTPPPARKASDPVDQVVITAIVLTAVGALIPATGPLILIVMGSILALRSEFFKVIGGISVALGASFLTLSVLDEGGWFNSWISLASLGMTVALLVMRSKYRRSKP